MVVLMTSLLGKEVASTGFGVASGVDCIVGDVLVAVTEGMGGPGLTGVSYMGPNESSQEVSTAFLVHCNGVASSAVILFWSLLSRLFSPVSRERRGEREN